MKKRKPMQVAEKFAIEMKNLQKDVMMAIGKDPSLRDLTEKIATHPLFNEIKKDIAKGKNDIKMDIKIKLDGRRFFG